MTDFLDDMNRNEAEGVREKPDIQTTVKALKDSVDGTFNTIVFYGLSELTADEMGHVRQSWAGLPVEHRQKLLSRLIDVGEANFDLDYRAVGWHALYDEDAAVRASAIELLWEDESLELMGQLIEMAQWDESAHVRAGAASALGRFILMGELGDLPEAETMRAQDVVVNLFTNQNEEVEVRRRSLEAIANCSHEIVTEAIEEAYYSGDPDMQASAIYVMGKSCDERWADAVLHEIGSDDPQVRYEAARASGELELEEALPQLARLVQGADREIKEIAIWSLGEIGGGYALRVLGALAEEAEESGDDELLEAVEEALSSASLAGGNFDFDIDD